MAGEGLLTIEDLSARLKVSVSTIYGWIHDGRVPYVKLGRMVRFEPAAIENWIRAKSREDRPGCQAGPGVRGVRQPSEPAGPAGKED